MCQAADEAQGDIQNYDRGHHGGNGDEPPEFYYHFKDIYDVLEWIGCNDFKDQLQGQYDSMEKWAYDLMEVLRGSAAFMRSWRTSSRPMIVRGVRMALDAQVRRLLWRESGHV